jgi:hypothetical protein
VLALPDTIEDVIDELAPYGLVLANAQAVSETLLLSHPIMAPSLECEPQSALAVTAAAGGRGQAH